jgi:hypothetical protein
MNDQNDFQDLDARAAAAATDLRAAAGSRPRPAFDPERSPAIPVGAPAGAGRAVPRRTLAAVAAALVLVAGGVIWAAARPDDDRPGPVTTTTDAPRPFVLGSVPDGFSLAGAGEDTGTEQPVSDGSAGPLAIYGPAPDDPQVGVAAIGTFDPEGLGVEAEPIEVGGVEAYVFDGRGFGPRAVIVPIDDLAVLAFGPTLEREQLVGLIDGARIVDGSVVLGDGALPAGWTELGEEPSVIGLLSPVAVLRGSGGAGAHVGYQSGQMTAEDADEVRTIFISSMPGDEVRLHAPKLAANRTERVTVRGRDAIAGSATTDGGDGAASTTSFVTWLERPGELIRITAMGVPLDELVRIAESAEPIEAAAWDDLVERTMLGEFDTGEYRESGGELVEMARGRFEDGTAWVVRVWPADGEDPTGPNASIDLQVALGGDSTSGSSSGSGAVISSDGQPVPEALGSSTSVNQGGRTFGAGFVGAEVESVVLVGVDGAELGRAEIVSGLGRRAWVAEAVDGAVEVVARAADGTELGRQGFGDGSAPIPAGPTTIVEGPGD